MNPDKYCLEKIKASHSNFALAYDCQPLLNNFSNQRQSSWLYDVDYNFGTVIPSNWAAIISQSAIKADVPDSNYTQFSSISPRYLGKQAESEEINIWKSFFKIRMN